MPCTGAAGKLGAGVAATQVGMRRRRADAVLTASARGALLLAAATLATMAGASEPMDFRAALERMEARAPEVLAAQQVLRQGQAGVLEARGRRLPELHLDGRYTWIDGPLGFELDPVRRFILDVDPDWPPALLPSDITFQQRRFGTLGATASWPVYTGGRIRAGIEAAEAAEAAGGAAFDATLGELRVELVRRYFGQQLAEQALAVREATAAGLRRHRDDALKLEREGQIARAERLRADVALAEAQRDVEAGQRDLALARAGLAALLGRVGGVQAVTPMPGLPPAPGLAPVQALALAHNPSLREARLQQRRADAGVRAARGERGPTVAVFGRRELYTRDLTLLEPDWAVGVALNWPLYDGGQRRSRWVAAAAVAEEVGAQVAAGERDLELLVQQRHQVLANALSRLESFQATRDLALESLRVQRRAFEEGLASSLDVVDAELALSRVDLGALAARYEGLVALAELYQAAGESARVAGFASGRMAPWPGPAPVPQEVDDAR